MIEGILYYGFAIPMGEERIAIFELVAAVINTLLFTQNLPNKTWATAACDNTNVLAWIARAKAGPPEVKKLIQNFLLALASKGALVNFSWIRTDANMEADKLSRKRSAVQEQPLMKESEILAALDDLSSQARTISHQV